MIIQFLRIAGDSLESRTAYIRRKLGGFRSCSDAAERWAGAAAREMDFPLLAERSEWPVLSDQQEAGLAEHFRCGSAIADRTLKLDEDEVVENDLFSYLAQSWGKISVGTPVLRRTTNRAVVLFFFSDLTIDSEQPGILLSTMKPETTVETVSGDADGEGMVSIEELPDEKLQIFIDIALSIAKGLATKLASVAIEKVMGSSVPDYFGEVYQQMSTIVREELDKATIRQISDEFIGAQDWNNFHYLIQKRNGAPYSELELAMSTRQQTFYEKLAKLKNPQVAAAALSEFAIGASMHLAFLQELVEVSGGKRSYKEELAANAQAHANHAAITFNAKLVPARAQLIQTKNDKTCEPVNGYVKYRFYWTSHDEATNTDGQWYFYTVGDKDQEKTAKEHAESDVKSRREAEELNLSKNLGHIQETIAAWHELRDPDR